MKSKHGERWKDRTTQPPIATPSQLPAVARARVNRLTDGLFALDHDRHEATLMDTIPREVARMPPFQGIHSELQPFQEMYLRDGDWPIGYRRSTLTRCTTITLPEQLPKGLTLRLCGHPFNGETSYTVL
jgi:hypothetical protein